MSLGEFPDQFPRRKNVLPRVAALEGSAQMPDSYIEDLFTYHAPKPGQLERYQAIRDAAKTLAKVIVANTPRSADQSAAIRELRICVMTANASIALDPTE